MATWTAILPALRQCSSLRAVTISPRRPTGDTEDWDDAYAFSDALVLMRSLPAQLLDLNIVLLLTGCDSDDHLAAAQRIDWHAFEHALGHCRGLRRVRIGVYLQGQIHLAGASKAPAPEIQQAILGSASPQISKLIRFF